MSLFPLKIFTDITANSFDSVGSKAITHGLDEIGRKLVTRPCHHVVITTRENWCGSVGVIEYFFCLREQCFNIC